MKHVIEIETRELFKAKALKVVNDRIHFFWIRPNPNPNPKFHRIQTESESESLH